LFSLDLGDGLIERSRRLRALGRDDRIAEIVCERFLDGRVAAMRDPLAWSIPLGRLFNTTIRVHVLFPFVMLGLVMRVAFKADPRDSSLYAYPDRAWVDVAIALGLMFLSVFLHEFGHVFGARLVHGDASEILIWPLGGLASVDVPHTPRANFICVAGGPLVNLVLGALAGVLLYFSHPGGPMPYWNPLTLYVRGDNGLFALNTWGGSAIALPPYGVPVILSQLFWANYVLFLLNMVLVGFPMDAGRMLQCILWPHTGYRQATLTAVYAGFVTVCVVFIFSLVTESVMAFALALFIYMSCRFQYIVLETGGDDSLFGYDFSQGYTSLERDEPRPAPPRRKPNWWQRWHQGRAARKLQREQERREADERRMDALLEKISTHGIAALTDEERRFMKQFSDRYRNK
jgi:Zn-dependent protease